MKEHIYIGIDPGKSGAIAVLGYGGHDTIKLTNTEHDVSRWLRSTIEGEQCFAYIERVNAMPGQGVSSMFKFGQSFGFLRGLLVAYDIPFEMVSPAKWQGDMKCRTKGDKNVSKARAQELFPRVKMIHAIADALLIAEYCRRTLTRS